MSVETRGLPWVLCTAAGLCAAQALAAPADTFDPRSESPLSAPERGQIQASSTDPLRVLVVQVEGLDEEEFAAALRLRLADRVILRAGDPKPEDGFAYLHVDRVPPATLRITLVERNGRAYDRTLDHEPDQAVRAAAATVATLVSSIESGNVEPDRHDAAIPVLESQPEPEPEPEGAPERVPEPDPVASPSVPRGWVGVSASGVAVLGVAPRTSAGPLGGGGAALGGTLMFAGGALAQFEVRALHRERLGLQTTRARFSLGGGYSWRWAEFALSAAAHASLEPWWIRRSGSAVDLQLSGLPATRRPLLGVHASLEPVWRVPVGRRSELRMGPRIALGGAAVPTKGLRTARIDVVDPGGRTGAASRLGGLEADLGVTIGLWIPVFDRRAP